MKRKLLRQMLNQWRSNVWMLVQLFIVSGVCFYISTSLYFNLERYSHPLGFDCDDTYQLTLAEIPEGGQGYVEGRDEAMKAGDVLTIVERLRALPQVESLALSDGGGPYNASYMGNQLDGVVGSDTLHISANQKRVTPEFVKVFRIASIDGSTPDQLMQALAEGKMLASKEAIDNGMGLEMHGKEKIFAADYCSRWAPDAVYRMGGLIQSSKRFDFDAVTPMLYLPLGVEKIKWLPEVSIRLRPGSDGEEFMREVREKTPTLFSLNNVYIQNVQPYSALKVEINARYNQKVLNGIAVMVFFMANVFLGLLGIFWFRTRQRTPEIALRKSFGATSGSIFRRLVSEGLLLLVAATPLAMAADWLMVKKELAGDFFLNYKGIAAEPERFFVPVAFTFAVMAIVIIATICLPAWRAMRIQPSEALRDE